MTTEQIAYGTGSYNIKHLADNDTILQNIFLPKITQRFKKEEVIL